MSAVVGARLAITFVADAFAVGGWRAATITAADEIAGQIVGINPTVSATIARTITNSLDAQRVIGQLTREANDRLAADPALARKVLSPREYAAGVDSEWVAKAQWGNAVERLVWQSIREDEHLFATFTRLGGPNKADFAAFGRNFDITTETEAQILSHMKRHQYGKDLIVVTYDRPVSFTKFPGKQ